MLLAIPPLLLGLPAQAEHAAHDHAEHMKMLEHPAFSQSTHAYAIPEVALRDESGRSIALTKTLAEDKAVIVNFIYTSCTTICPVMTATMLQLQRSLAKGGPMPAFVSISVDPAFDSSEILKAYAAKYGANWTFLTGANGTVLSVLEHFDVWRGGKANHAAVTLMRPAGRKMWTRVDGLASAEQLAGVWKSLRG
jgi:protein SCO1/2